MIILSVGMPRAGSGWYYNLTNDLMLASGAQDARQIRTRYHLQSILTEVNCNIGALTTRRMLAVLVPSIAGNTFVLKAHAGPTPIAVKMIEKGWVKPTYIYRDPRDAMLSAYENGQRARMESRQNAFSQLTDFDTTLRFIKDYVRISKAWLGCEKTLHTRYENLLLEYEEETRRLVVFLGLALESQALQAVLKKYQPEKASSDQKGLHFSHGKIGRFRTKMSVEEQGRMYREFKDYLDELGYPP